MSGIERARTIATLSLIFVVHQLVATLGIAVGVRYGLYVVSKIVSANLGPGSLYQTSTAAPFFPLQLATALLLGCLLGRWLGHRSMLWVWILPSILLVYAFWALPTLTPHVTPLALQAGVGQSRVSHYFGTGCQPEYFCFDQVLVTLPFYTSALYSLSAYISRRVGGVPQTFSGQEIAR